MAGEEMELADKGWLYHPDYPDHWERCPLHSLAEWVNGLAFRDIQFSPSGMPVIKIAEIKGGISGQTNFTQQTFDESVRVRPGDLLFSWSGQPETSIDAFWWRGPQGWLNQHVFRVTPADGIDPTFFYYLLRYLKPNFVGIARNKQTTGLGHVTKRDLENIEAAYPELPEQRAIAHILGTLDDKIELNRRMSETLEAMARAIFKAWFVDFEPVRAKMEGRWRRRESLPGLSAHLYDLFPDRLVDSELGEIPEGWGVGTLGHFMTQRTERVRDREVIVLSAIASGKLVRSDDYFTKRVYSTEVTNYLLVEQWDIAYNPSRINIGSVGMLEEPIVGAVSPVYVVARPKAEYRWFLQFSLRRAHTREWIDTLASGSVRQSLSYTDFASIPSVVPPKDVTMQFDKAWTRLRAGIQAYSNQDRTLAALRDALLPKLISGKLRVKDVEKFIGRPI